MPHPSWTHRLRRPLPLFGLGFGLASLFALPVSALAQDAQTKTSKQPTVVDAFVAFSDDLQRRLPFFLAAGLIMVLSFLVARMAASIAERALSKSTVHRTAFGIVSKSAYVGALVIGFTVALKVAGLDISFVIGAATFGLGFAMKDLIENYISGVIIVLQEPFHVGDMIDIGGTQGWVEQIEARVTFVKSLDGQRIIVPNSQMISNALVNYSTFQQRRLSVKVGVSYDTDLQQVLGIVKGVLEQDDEVLKSPAPLVLFQEFGDSALSLEARFWIDQAVSHWLRVPSKISVKIKRALDAAGVNIPFPIMTLNVNSHDSGDLAIAPPTEAKNAAPSPVAAPPVA